LEKGNEAGGGRGLTFLMQASPASWSSLLVELRALKRAAMIFSRDWGR